MSYRVNALKHAHFDLFELGQLVREQVESVLGAVTHLLILLSEKLRIEWRQPRCSAVRAGSIGELARGVSGMLSTRRLLAHGGSSIIMIVAKLTVGLANHGHKAVLIALSMIISKCC